MLQFQLPLLVGVCPVIVESSLLRWEAESKKSSERTLLADEVRKRVNGTRADGAVNAG